MAKQVKLLVMSDSHGDRAIVEEIKAHYQGQVDAMFHNGDSEIPSADPIWNGIFVVTGNCDYDAGYPASQLVEVGGLRIAQTHGHLYSINFTWQKLDYWAQEMEADICLYGHLHIPDATVRGKTLFLNPGSVSQPRGMVRECLYAIITVTEERISVHYYDRNHVLYAPLTKEIAR